MKIFGKIDHEQGLTPCRLTSNTLYDMLHNRYYWRQPPRAGPAGSALGLGGKIIPIELDQIIPGANQIDHLHSASHKHLFNERLMQINTSSGLLSASPQEVFHSDRVWYDLQWKARRVISVNKLTCTNKL